MDELVKLMTLYSRTDSIHTRVRNVLWKARKLEEVDAKILNAIHKMYDLFMQFEKELENVNNDLADHTDVTV